jgi:pimeloyl-ACP methyl ester carboxylesterase
MAARTRRRASSRSSRRSSRGPTRRWPRIPKVREWALGTFREALRGGAAGVVQDAAIQARPWGFGLEQIRTPLQLWHGDRDQIVPLHHASYAAERVPDATLNVVEGTGHLLALSHGAEITRALIT